MKYFKSLFKENLLLRITSLNASVIIVRLIVSLFVQRILAVNLGETGIAKIGQLRNVIQMLTGLSSLGTFNGVVKYVAEFNDNKKKLKEVFNTVFVFWLIGSVLSGLFLFFNAHWISERLFGHRGFTELIYVLALMPMVIGANRIFHGVVNGLSEYKKYAKIDLFGYLAATVLMLLSLLYYNLKGVLFAIALTPIIQCVIILLVFRSVLKRYLKWQDLRLKTPYLKPFLGFALMSMLSSVLLNYIELDIRTLITDRINIEEAGYWTAVNFISKNYMVFSSGVFSLYVIPKFARIYSGKDFKQELVHIYKTLLPLFGLGMLLVYFFRFTVIEIIYPDFTGMAPLFKWQLLGDFIRLASLVMAHQFLAKKLVKSFVFTELISLAMFYFLSKYLVGIYGVEGVVMAHFYRYIVYFLVVGLMVWYFFKRQGASSGAG